MVVPRFQLLMKPMVYKAELCANKVVSDSLELVDFAIGLPVVNYFPDLLDGQVKFFLEEFELQKYCKTNCCFQFLTNSFGSKAYFKLIWQHEIIAITYIITMNK